MVQKAASAYKTISEVSAALDVPAHVLRFWETKFSQLKPMKRSGGRRYYRQEDIALLQTIKALLYDEGYTIKGAQASLSKRRKSKANASANASAGVNIGQNAGQNIGGRDAVEAQAARSTPANLSEAARLLSQAQGRIDTLLAQL
jgi:DNA-binding transcriptional MerR regulator